MNTSFGTYVAVLKLALSWNRAHRPKPRRKTHTSRGNPIELPLLNFSIRLRSETKDHLGSIVDIAKPEKTLNYADRDILDKPLTIKIQTLARRLVTYKAQNPKSFSLIPALAPQQV